MRWKSAFVILFVILLTVVTSFAGVSESIQREFLSEFKEGSELWIDWKAGLKAEFGLSLDSVSVLISNIDERIVEDKVEVIAHIVLTCFCYDASGNKKIFVADMLMGYILDKASHKILYGQLLQASHKILDGWSTGSKI
jgi:hypothetical protein